MNVVFQKNTLHTDSLWSPKCRHDENLRSSVMTPVECSEAALSYFLSSSRERFVMTKEKGEFSKTPL